VATGPALIYEVIVQTTGYLEVDAQGSPLLRTSILAGCDDEEVRACGSNHASSAVTAGERRFVRIAGLEPQDVGEITVDVRSRPGGVCGDGYRDPPEGCDDGAREPSDGCDADCAVELGETEPNQGRESADPWTAPFFAEITPEDDEDFVTFDLALGGTLVAETLGVGADTCEGQTLDSLLELFDASGDPLASDDDSGVGYCSRITRTYTQAGTYYLRVTASPTGSTPTFPYQLTVSVE
jgi:cysteine-rich repeat protein